MITKSSQNAFRQKIAINHLSALKEPRNQRNAKSATSTEKPRFLSRLTAVNSGNTHGHTALWFSVASNAMIIGPGENAPASALDVNARR